MADKAAVVRKPSRILMIGAFPPPLHGMSAVNAAVRQRLTDAGADLSIVNVAASSVHRGFWSRLGRLPRILWGLLRLACARNVRNGALYMSVSGGFGQAYDLLFVLLARAKSLRIFLHHHSFAYLDHSSSITAMLLKAAGSSACHIVLSDGMAERLQACYPGVATVVSVSNAALLLADDGQSPPMRERLGVVGFISNISIEKGVHEFLDVCAAAQELGLPIRATLAGPFQDAEVEKSVRDRLKRLPGVAYMGPIYGEQKAKFFAGIDVLLFPTRYANEAEPLTIHEAMSAGIPVIAYGRGAIPEILTPACGKVVPVGDEFTQAAIGQIVAWLATPQALESASLAASARFAMLRAENVRHWEALKASLLGGSPVGILADANALASPDQSNLR